MAVKIRLSRTGKKNAPSYRIVAIDSRHPQGGRALEILGHYNPSQNPPSFSINKERIDHWQSVGAQMTEAVEKLLEGKYEYKKYKPKSKGTEKDEDK